jgi:predicted nucleotidyltransferase
VADTRDKILGTPLTNEERTEFTRYMTQGGQFEMELLRYFKSNAYKFDKEESAQELLQGKKPSETSAYMQVQKIIDNYTRLAMYEMGKGLTPTAQGFMNRRTQQISQARQDAFAQQERQNQQRQIQQLREYPFQ